MLLSLAAIYNGYPLVYWDSGSYLRALIEWHNLPDRPVFYSVLLGLLHWRWSLWPVVFGQSILTVFVIDRTLTGLVPRCSATVSLSVLAILTGATSLPWFTGQIMPYLFAPIVVLKSVPALYRPVFHAEVAILGHLLRAGRRRGHALQPHSPGDGPDWLIVPGEFGVQMDPDAQFGSCHIGHGARRCFYLCGELRSPQRDRLWVVQRDPAA